MRPETPQPVRLEDYRPAPYRIDTVDLDIRLDPQATQVTARLRLARNEGTAAGTPLVLDGDGLTLTGLALDGRPLPGTAYAARPDRLDLFSPPAEPFDLEIVTRLDPDSNTALMGLYRSSGTWCTQCEAEGFRRITYFLDRPDVLAVYTTRLEAPKHEAPVLLANGNPVDAGEIPDSDRHYAVWHDPHPKPSYLFALVAGDLARVTDRFVTRSGRPVDLAIYVEHGKEDHCGWAMESLKRSMAWDEAAFGCEYDLDVFNIVAVSDFNMGAMENKGLNIFNDKYVLADPDTATDQDYAHIEAVIAHEYFHNWTGNRITCRDWFQLCLKEGLTVFRDQEFTSDMRSRPVKRIADVRLLKSHQFPEDAGPLAHPVRPKTYREINNFYTATVYEKGAEVVRMLKILVGDDAFRSGMDLYLRRHDATAATIEDFLACFAEASGEDLTQFALWYEQAGTPQVTASSRYDGDARTFALTLSQQLPPVAGQGEGKPAAIPIRFALIGPNGQDMAYDRTSGGAVSGDVIHLTERSQTIVFSGVSQRPVPSLLRGFSAPVRLETDLDPHDLLFLTRHDGDPFNRWQAVQELATRDLVRLSAAAQAGEPLRPDAAFVTALGEILDDERLDAAFRAQALHLPGEADIAREIGRNVDPDAILAARTALRKAIARAHGDACAETVLDLAPTTVFSPDAASAGRRALKNLALGYVAVSGLPDAADMVIRQFDTADNMTDRLAALTILVHEGIDGADEALAAFRDRHARHALAIDKWFTVQATRPADATPAAVRALTGDEGFDWGNPNRVRSLVNAFATGNQTQFARTDGAGFDLVAEAVLQLDERNPQVAARLLSAFRSWRALEPVRARRAEAALHRIAARETLSKDARDIVDRCLQ
ncbi:aminopeptidase N [Polymorphum gilvum]|uniref:Aminopeptidase N n=1 Tax=Polymorphum gilvum (strain LMG 25793 / CGMCC 1.9160 / SL003B-26A1) TaxID=991905 RepID=F2J6E4_POLGS|nr:aminopeptidase N [Polymorphum gilvum]ADZ71318.1 Probable aminopeptidase n protein [Polymorphum gilvum SL003B-26A1]